MQYFSLTHKERNATYSSMFYFLLTDEIPKFLAWEVLFISISQGRHMLGENSILGEQNMYGSCLKTRLHHFSCF